MANHLDLGTLCVKIARSLSVDIGTLSLIIREPYNCSNVFSYFYFDFAGKGSRPVAEFMDPLWES
jgi:hypothetical protein